MSVLFIDVESTGFANTLPLDHPSQPHLVQLCGLPCDHAGTILNCVNVLIRPDGWVSEPGALAVHGITHEQAMDEGIPEWAAIEQLLSMAPYAARRVAHCEFFDSRMIEIALARYFPVEHLERWRQEPEPYCTMFAARRHGLGDCSLADVYHILFGEALIGHHDALRDAMACRRIYLELMHREAVAALAPKSELEQQREAFRPVF